MEFSPVLIWFLVGLALIILEFFLPGIILVFFGVGAWIASLTTWLGVTEGQASQLLVFAVSSVVLLIVLRRRVRGRFLGHASADQNPNVDLDEFSGKPVTVTVDIAAGHPGGRVEFKGAGWAAAAEEDIPAGEQAVITRIEGLTLHVARPGSADAGATGPQREDRS